MIGYHPAIANKTKQFSYISISQESGALDIDLRGGASIFQNVIPRLRTKAMGLSAADRTRFQCVAQA